MKGIVYSCFLVVMAIQDIKRRSISLNSILLMALCLILVSVLDVSNGKLIFLGTDTITDVNNLIGTSVFTLIFLIYALVTKCIGYGDVVILLISSLFMGWLYALKVFVLALIVMIVVAIIGIHLKKLSYKQQIPFIPYLLIGQMGVALFV